MIAEFPPGLLLIGGAVLVPFLRGNLRSAYTLILPLLGILQLLMLEPGSFGAMASFGFEQTHVRVDKLSLLFGYIFYIAAVMGVIFAWHNDDPWEKSTALIYVGAAIGATFAGDLITLFFYWELAAIAAVFIIWAARTDRSFRAGLRCLLIYMVSGVLLLSGTALLANATGSVAFNNIGLESPGGILILLAFGIKCAFPFLHNWLQDGYPEASATGTVFLSAFTTKLAVYALARGFAGTEILIWIGVTMTAFPIFYAVIENDLRRVLAYSLNNQLGFMVTGIGIGSALAINGAVSHAFAHIIYKALLFMSMGAVLYRTGTVKGSELGGLYKTMPWTTGFCIVGGASISAFPLFSGFVTKSMVLTAVANEGYVIPFLILLFASAGVFHHSGIKIPFFAFFAHDSGKRPKEAPFNMLFAMGIAAFLCIGIGVYPQPLYALLPFPVDYVPYTTTHVITMLQLLVFSGLAFATLQRTGLYPPELRSTVLDFDFSYRWLGPRIVGWCMSLGGRVWSAATDTVLLLLSGLIARIFRTHGPHGILARTWPTGSMVLWAAALLALSLVFYY
ncbi:MAG: Na(+)/H(+) antiporter subunit D [Alphaproteobacteria bacterium]|jgi:multicomponent Na+:H+ antiporter subunit D|nr:Na(+)/H(+) antiporter subunit D [Alphaproteobacteria bacterium]MDP6832859.1 Na(+)/H(+) antiporter subunit D [Alphaproteobacteria bacterium]